MIGLLIALSVATCDAGQVAHLEQSRRSAACDLLAQPVAVLNERPSLEDVYARPGFERARRRDAGAMQTLLAQLLQKLRGLFETRGAESFSYVTRVIVLAVALTLALALSLRLTRRRTALLVNGNRPDTPTTLDSPGVHLARARELEALSPREGLREALLALLSALECARLARADRVKTNRELVAELPARGASAALTSTVSRLVAQFDSVYYSLEPVSAALTGDFIAQVEPLVEQVA